MLFSRRTSLATGVHVVVLLATLVIGGCGGQPVGGGGEQPPGQQLPQCSSDADCPEGEVCSADGTCEVSPVVLTITPDVGSTAGGTAVAILASDPLFLSDLVVLFGAATATDVSVVNPYALTATTPPNPAGTVRIMVIGAQGEVGTIPDGFTYTDARLPGVTPLSATAAAPDTGPTSGGTLVTIIGTGLTADTAVLFGGHASNQATLVNELVLTAITPAHAAGTVDVGLLQPNTELVTRSGAFT